MGISVTISMMGGGGVVAVLGVVDSGLYGGGMASLYHLVADLETLDLGHLGQLSQQEDMHTDMKIHTLASLVFIGLYVKISFFRFHS